MLYSVDPLFWVGGVLPLCKESACSKPADKVEDIKASMIGSYKQCLHFHIFGIWTESHAKQDQYSKEGWRVKKSKVGDFSQGWPEGSLSNSYFMEV